MYTFIFAWQIVSHSQQNLTNLWFMVKHTLILSHRVTLTVEYKGFWCPKPAPWLDAPKVFFP